MSLRDEVDKAIKSLETLKDNNPVDMGIDKPSIEDMLKELKERDKKRNEEIREFFKPKIEKMLKSKSKKRNCSTCQHSLDLFLTQYNNTPLGSWTCRICDDGSGSYMDWTPIKNKDLKI